MRRVSLRVAEQETEVGSGGRTASAAAPTAVEVLVFTCLLVFGVASIVAPSPGGARWGGFSPALLIGGWVVVFAGLAALHAQDRKRRTAERGVVEPATSISSATSAAPIPEEAPAPPPRQPDPPAAARQPDPPAAPAPDRGGYLERSIALCAERRFVEAARAAHDGLANGADPGPLLVVLSRAELARGQIERAIDSARDALFVSRGRDSVANLIRILTVTRRFEREDGPMLRRAAARHPDQAILRHALGVFESMHGDAEAAREQLQAALQLGASRGERQAIERDLERARQATANGTVPVGS